jgi:hypothetical protein
MTFEALFWAVVALVGLGAAAFSYASRRIKVALDPQHWARRLSVGVQIWLALCDAVYVMCALLFVVMTRAQTIDVNRRNLAMAVVGAAALAVMTIENARLWNKPVLPEPDWAVAKDISGRRYARLRRAQVPVIVALWAFDLAVIAHATLDDPWRSALTFLLACAAVAAGALGVFVKRTGKPEWLVPPGRRGELVLVAGSQHPGRLRRRRG